MTKEELVAVVDRVFASWNQQINPNNQKVLYEAWWRVLKDLNKNEVDDAIDQLVIEDGYMPRPGAVRKQTINNYHGWKPPTGAEAWQQFRMMADAAHTGTYTNNNTIHELVKITVAELGGTAAYNLHTNGDRQQFLETYQTVVNKFESALYALPTTLSTEISTD
jgi:hypothetical protein